MKEDISVLIEYFGNHPMIRIVDFLIENKIFDYSKKQIAEEVGISKATFFKYFIKLEEIDIVRVSRRFGKTKLYRINEDSPIVKRLVELGLTLADVASEKMTHERKLPIKVRI